MPTDPLRDAEVAATYVVSCVSARAGARLKQGARKAPLAQQPMGRSLDLVATTRLLGVSQPVAEALVAWGQGRRRVHLLDRVPRPVDVLAWQARGERCVSLLDHEVATAPHEDGLAFAMHDLCHLEKFFDPAHHAGQVGFFRAVNAAVESPRWAGFLARFDADFVCDLEHVVADMNGSAVFLFAALKMKLKMAVRRRGARERGGEARVAGPLDEEERSAFAFELDTLLDHLQVPGGSRGPAVRVSTRRDDLDAALAVLAHFEALGCGAGKG